jgi:hypothetical protein
MCRQLSGLALLICLAGPVQAAEEASTAVAERPLMRWQPAVYRWYYNPADAPDWLTAEESRQKIIAAVAGWAPCGVELVFAGDTVAPSGRSDGLNVIGWSHALRQRGVTQGRGRRDGRLVERDVTLAAAREEFHRFPRLLDKVIAHEVGHALGLVHAQDCADVMSFGANCKDTAPPDLPVAPTAGDLDECAKRYGK